MFGRALGGRVAYALGYTGLVHGRDSELTRLELVRRRPIRSRPSRSARASCSSRGAR